MPPTVTPGLVFDGVDPVIEAVASRLEATVPAELDRLELVHGRPVPVLVPPEDPADDLWRLPQLYARSDRAVIEPDDYPAILVVPQATGQAEIVDWRLGAPVWRIPYQLRVWAFCRYFDNSGAGVAACRNRLALAARQSLLRAPRLTETMAVEQGGWRESFSDVGVDDRDQSTVAGWWLEVIVVAEECVTLDSIAQADTITVLAHPEAD